MGCIHQDGCTAAAASVPVLSRQPRCRCTSPCPPLPTPLLLHLSLPPLPAPLLLHLPRPPPPPPPQTPQCRSLVVEAHAVEDVADVGGALGGVWQAAVGGAVLRPLFVAAPRAPGDVGACRDRDRAKTPQRQG
jgi:hypothetical protein